MKKIYSSFLLIFSSMLFGQSNISLSAPEAFQVLTGNYNPGNYAAPLVIDEHDQIICELDGRISPDSLQHYLEVLGSFYTRHTFSDTVSDTLGIGAARRWVYQKFEEFSAENNNCLIPSYLEFDWLNNVCGSLYDTKNVLGILPGGDTAEKGVIIIEAHMDSRCEGRCDTTCEAQGIDDNASGTAMVIELARVMSRYSFDHSIVFMATTGEEQGLLGATAMAQLAEDHDIAIKAVQNNDVIGGVICGTTASPPGCAPPGSIDSLDLRLYANPISYLHAHQSFARSIKMFYEEKLQPNVKVPMSVNVMEQEDRTGRGGDHIPFRQRGFRNVRFTSAHEHGHGAPDSTYTDRQHTSEDILGLDTNGDGEIDSFFVDLNYLARNTVINAMSASLLALGPETPEFTVHDEPGGLRVEVLSSQNVPEYRLGVRTGNQVGFDQVYRFSGQSFVVPGQTNGEMYYLSVAAIDTNGIMSPFSVEERKFSQANTAAGTPDNFPYGINCNLFGSYEVPFGEASSNVELLPCRPNPFSESTTLIIQVNELPTTAKASIVVADQTGKRQAEIPIELRIGENQVEYKHPGSEGVFIYSLKLGERIVGSRKMIVR